MKKRIREKAEELFRLYGIRAVTMDEISMQLGISKKTLYQFFDDKRELVDAVIRKALDANMETCEACKLEATNAIEEGFRANHLVTQMLGDLNPSILFDLERGYPKIFERFEKYKYGFLYEFILENIRWGKADGLFRDNVNEEIYAKSRLEMIMLPFNDQLFPKSRFTFSGLQNELMKLYYYSMATPKGWKLIQDYEQAHKLTNPKQ